MDEFWKSLAEVLRKRANTTLLATYTFFWIAYHWQGVYVTFMVPTDKIYEKYHLLKNEYVARFCPGWDNWHFYLGVLVPALLTYCFIWILPDLIFIRAFKKERKYKLEKQTIILQDGTELEKIKTSLARENAKALEAEKKVVQEEQAIIELDPKKAWKAWEAEYDRFSKNSQTDILESIIDSVYEHSGHIKKYYDEDKKTWVNFYINTNELALADASGLINVNKDNSAISVTDKGKYFIGQYLNGRPS